MDNTYASSNTTQRVFIDFIRIGDAQYLHPDAEHHISTCDQGAPICSSACVDVNIVTSERLMILEQLFTAGTTTTRCIKKMVKKHRRMKKMSGSRDEEAGLRKIGNLVIEYFQPKPPVTSAEPLQSHLKLTIVDEEWVVLGSGNMDRASWYTSQELDVAFCDRKFARTVKESLDLVLQERKRIAFSY